jgi:hypothetical protein
MSEVITKLLEDTAIPKFFRVKQVFPKPHIPAAELRDKVFEDLSRPVIAEKIRSGMSIAITAGSRGIANYVIILRAIAEFVKSRGAHPFVIAAMGSHGGARADSQKAVLAGYGITEESIGCPVRATMEVTKIGLTPDNRDVYLNKYAAEADGFIVFCRVKPHTCFRGPYQSGIMKMMAIGLANQAGAENCHEQGYELLPKNIHLYGKAIIDNSKMLFAVPAVENAYDETYKLLAVDRDEVESTEPELLREATDLMPRILVDNCDVLVVDELGKNFSGDGMDPNITGTFCTPYADGGIKSQYVCVLDLSPETQGNGIGIGMANATTRRCFEKLDLDEMYPNSITSVEVGSARIPVIMENDRETIQLCIKICVGNDKNNPRLVRIPNSSFIQHILLSESYYREVKGRDDIIIESEPFELSFDNKGNLMDLEPRVRS